MKITNFGQSYFQLDISGKTLLLSADNETQGLRKSSESYVIRLGRLTPSLPKTSVRTGKNINL